MTTRIAIAAFCAAMLIGCGSGSGSTPTVTNATDAAKDNIVAPDAKIYHDTPPESAVGSGGFRITPPDPNDPRIKPQPGIAGAG